MMRKIISMATITLTVSEYIEEGTNLTHIDIQQVATGGISGTTERRTLDWEFRDHSDGIFGEVQGKSRWVLLENVDKGTDREWLTRGWLDESGGEHVQSYVVSQKASWTAEQVSLRGGRSEAWARGGRVERSVKDGADALSRVDLGLRGD